MALMKRLACLTGRHERSRSKADLSGPVFRSVCRHCGAPMVKVRDHWRVETQADAEAAEPAAGQ